MLSGQGEGSSSGSTVVQKVGSSSNRHDGLYDNVKNHHRTSIGRAGMLRGVSGGPAAGALAASPQSSASSCGSSATSASGSSDDLTRHTVNESAGALFAAGRPNSSALAVVKEEPYRGQDGGVGGGVPSPSYTQGAASDVYLTLNTAKSTSLNRKMARRDSDREMTTPDSSTAPVHAPRSLEHQQQFPAGDHRPGASPDELEGSSSTAYAHHSLGANSIDHSSSSMEHSPPPTSQAEALSFGERQAVPPSSTRRDVSDNGSLRPARRKIHRIDTHTEPSQPYRSHSQSAAHRSLQESIALDRKQAEAMANFPTATLLTMLAELLTRITTTNDAIRDQQAQQQQQQTPQEHSSAGDPFEAGAVTPPLATHVPAEPVTPAVPFSSPVSTPGSQNQTAFPFPSSSTYRQQAVSRVRSSTDLLRESLAMRRAASRETPDRAQRNQLRYNFTTSDDALDIERMRSEGSSDATSRDRRRPRPTLLTSAAAALGTPNATLCFHARNVPSISIESYLIRISKCKRRTDDRS